MGDTMVFDRCFDVFELPQQFTSVAPGAFTDVVTVYNISWLPDMIHYMLQPILQMLLIIVCLMIIWIFLQLVGRYK